jgi:hypothetical protein
MEAPEKNRCNRSEPAQGQIFSGPVGGGNTAKSRPFSHISRAMQQNFSALETTWRRDRDSNLVIHRNLNNLLERVAAYTAD